ncbi:MAG: thiamine diphosphokinase [Puniceicoccales bacterium]|jgi:thiamine pyrophosphokinase|nr:thiamine diphosphokinase [Puniceicoccales bacterium]
MELFDQNFLKILPTFGEFRSIICLKGDLPEKELFDALGLPIIAADGAYNVLRAKQIKTEVVIGDLDSVGREISPGTQKIYIENQNQSDFQKALQYVCEKQLEPSIILGINGGYIDHILNNIAIFSQTNGVTYMPPNLGIMIRKNCTLHFIEGTKISLFAMPICHLTTQGLFWELDHKKLEFPHFSSCFNRCSSGILKISIHDGAIFTVVYLEDIVDAGKNRINF